MSDGLLEGDNRRPPTLYDDLPNVVTVKPFGDKNREDQWDIIQRSETNLYTIKNIEEFLKLVPRFNDKHMVSPNGDYLRVDDFVDALTRNGLGINYDKPKSLGIINFTNRSVSLFSQFRDGKMLIGIVKQDQAVGS